MMRILIVGLGNLPLRGTRHSVGHTLVDALASRFDVRMVKDRTLGGELAQTEVAVDGVQVMVYLFKSHSLMNISGPSIALCTRQHLPDPTHLILLHDSLSHAPLTLSPKLGGSANGHRGVQSVISALGGEKGFYRIRIGIGRKEGVDAAEYVLGALGREERAFWRAGGEGVERVWGVVEERVRALVKADSEA